MASIEECVTQPSIIKCAFNELTIDKSADKCTAQRKICKQMLVEKRGIIIRRISRCSLGLGLGLGFGLVGCGLGLVGCGLDLACGVVASLTSLAVTGYCRLGKARYQDSTNEGVPTIIILLQ